MKNYYMSLLCLATYTFGHAQPTAEEYGIVIFNQIIDNNAQLKNEFVDLVQYTAYIDRLEKLPEEERETMKLGATKSYTEVKQLFDLECVNILKLYQRNKKSGATFVFLKSVFVQSKNFPDIGLVTCYYQASIPGEEELLEDALVFECLKTESGWRILDGFFDAPEIN